MRKKLTYIRKKELYDSAEGYDKWATYYDQSLKFLDSMEGPDMRKMLGDLKGKKVLDAGGGTGRLVPLLLEKGAEVTVLDCSEKMLSICKRKFSRVETILGDVEEMPFAEGSFDIVVSAYLIVHLKDTSKFFDEAYRVLKDQGNFILTNLNQRKPPVLKIKNGETFYIDSYYHMREKVLEDLEKSFFQVKDEKVVFEGNIWINQIVNAIK